MVRVHLKALFRPALPSPMPSPFKACPCTVLWDRRAITHRALQVSVRQPPLLGFTGETSESSNSFMPYTYGPTSVQILLLLHQSLGGAHF